MKSIYEILESTPVKETVVIRFSRPDLPGHIDEVTVNEEQLRWLQYNIAKGEYPYGDVVIMDTDGTQIPIAADGRLVSPIKGSNILNYNDDLALGLLQIKAGLPTPFDECDEEEPEYPDYEDYDWPDDDYPDEYYSDPMNSAEEAFEYIEEEERDAECDKQCYLSGNTIEDLANLRLEESDEIAKYANTPHDDINVELKKIDEEIADRKMAEAIWSAREHIMDRIIFNNGDEYPIHSIDMEFDDKDRPVDIVITSRQKYLDEIAEKHCQLGYNCNEEEVHGFHTALYGRLDTFAIKDWDGNTRLY